MVTREQSWLYAVINPTIVALAQEISYLQSMRGRGPMPLDSPLVPVMASVLPWSMYPIFEDYLTSRPEIKELFTKRENMFDESLTCDAVQKVYIIRDKQALLDLGAFDISLIASLREERKGLVEKFDIPAAYFTPPEEIEETEEEEEEEEEEEGTPEAQI